MPYPDSLTSCNFKCIKPEAEYIKYYCKPSSLKILTTYEEIQKEVYINGPMMVYLTVYEDFISGEISLDSMAL